MNLFPERMRHKSYAIKSTAMTLNKHKQVILFLFTFFSFLSVFSQNIKHLGTNEGLGGRQAFNVIQDKKGFVWIATRFGIDRYDGLNIKHYFVDILYNDVNPVRTTQVLLDRKSELWAYTSRGTIYKYDDLRDEFVVKNAMSRYIKALAFDARNDIWMGARAYLFLVRNGVVEEIEHNILKGKDIKLIKEYDDETLLIITTKDVLQLNINTKEIDFFIDPEQLNQHELTIESCFYEKNERRLWLGSLSKGLYYYDINTREIHSLEDERFLYHPILSIVPYKNYLLLGMESVGMALLNKETWEIEQFYNQRADKNYRISGDAVYDIYLDKEEKIWLSTYSNGVNILDFNRQGFFNIEHQENNPNSLPSNSVCAVLEDCDKNIWFATDNGLSFWNRETETWKNFLTSNNIITLFQDSHENIWVAVYSSGVYVLNKQGRILNHFVHKKNSNSLTTNFVYSIAEDREGNIWLGGKKGHVSKYNVSTNTFTGVPIRHVNHILPQEEKIIVSTEAGVFYTSLDGKNPKLCAFNNNLKSSYISDIYPESDSIIWLATYGDGINRCNLLTGTVGRFTQKQGLRSNIIYSLLMDDEHNLWFSSENGIGKLNLLNYNVVNFSKADGIIGNRFRQVSRTKTSDGNLFFGSYEGAVYFNPRNIKTIPFQGNIAFENFNLFNQTVKAGDKNSPLKMSLDDTKEIVLKYNQHSFSIDFTAIDFSNETNRFYTWMLKGLDKNWITPTSEHVVNYTNIAPGKYVFKIQYLDNNQQILDRRELKIIVKPPFWNTTLARIIEILFILAILYAIYRYIKQIFRKKQSEEKIKFFINTAHDIRTPLTLINGPIFQLKEEIEPTEKTNYLFALVTKNLDKLNKMFSQLLDFQKAYELRDQLVVRERNVNNYLKEKIIHWQSLAQKKKIDLDIVLPEEAIVEWFDIEKMDRILNNLVSNAVKYTPEKGTVRVKLTSDVNHWKIEVIDSGIGISKQEKNNLFNRFYRASNAINSQEAGSGLGLLLIKQYVTLHKGRIGVDSVENKGSVFHIQFKHGREHYSENVKLDDYNIPIIDNKTPVLADEQQTVNKLRMKVLIAEDNDDLRTYLKLSLSHYYRIFTAKNGAEAWENIAKINPDFVVTDLQMPEMNGFELLEKIKSTFETSHIPVILLTVINDKQNITKGFNIGVDDYIEKPFNVEYLRLKIDNIIQNRKLLRQKFLGIDKSTIAEKEAENTNELNAEFVKKAIAIIEKNIDNPAFSISDFSKELNLSRSLLYNKFNAITGYTPNDFIKITRMKKAIEYFREKKHSINEVAYMVGFEDPAYFSNCFKKMYGESPRNFIEKHIS